MLKGLQIVVVGSRGALDTEALLAVVNNAALPNKVLNLVAPRLALPAHHPAAGKEQIEGRATAYICEGPVCSLPITDSEALASELARR